MSTREHTFHIAVDGERLAATLVMPDTTIPGVLFVHGWGGSQQQYLARAKEIAALGCIGLTFDLRGHASSDSHEDAVSREDSLRDVLAAYDELASNPNVDPQAIAVVGSSYGGYMGAILTTLRPVKWLALRVPALYPDEEWELPKKQLHRDGELEAYRRKPLRAGDNRALKACAEFAGDILIVESEHDELIPHATITNFVNASKHARSLTYRVIEGADHGLSHYTHQRAYTSILVNWLTEMVFGARQGSTAAEGSARAEAVLQEAPEHPA
jgi:pimeloyl-ACP methyl ester carboxylesterase